MRKAIPTPSPAPRLLLGTCEGLLAFHLDPDGSGWTAAEVLWRGGSVRALAVDPDEPSRLHLAAAGDGIYRSEDGGRTWERYLDVEAHVLVVRPDRPELLYLGAEPAEVFRSTDFGGHWTGLGLTRDLGEPLTPLARWRHVRTVAFDPQDGASLHVVVADGGLLNTFDGGRTWVELATQGLPETPACLLHVSKPQGTLLAGTSRGLLCSGDRGFHWQADGIGIEEPSIVALASIGDHLIAAAARATHTRLYHRPPGAARWWPAGEAIEGRVSALHTAPADTRAPWRGSAFAATSQGALWQGMSLGRSWSRMAHGLPPATALAWQPASDETA